MKTKTITIAVILMIACIACNKSPYNPVSDQPQIDRIHHSLEDNLRHYDSFKAYATMTFMIDKWTTHKYLQISLAIIIAVFGAMAGFLQKKNDRRWIEVTCVILGVSITGLSLYSEFLFEKDNKEKLSLNIEKANKIRSEIHQLLTNLQSQQIDSSEIKLLYHNKFNASLAQNYFSLLYPSGENVTGNNSSWKMVPEAFAQDNPNKITIKLQRAGLLEAQEAAYDSARNFVKAMIGRTYAKNLKNSLDTKGIGSDKLQKISTSDNRILDLAESRNYVIGGDQVTKIKDGYEYSVDVEINHERIENIFRNYLIKYELLDKEQILKQIKEK